MSKLKLKIYFNIADPTFKFQLVFYAFLIRLRLFLVPRPQRCIGTGAYERLDRSHRLLLTVLQIQHF